MSTRRPLIQNGRKGPCPDAKVIARDHLTSLMITHNMRDALRFGNRLVMMNAGRIVVDVGGEEKAADHPGPPESL